MPTLNELHQQHREWLKELDFYKDEVKFFQGKLLALLLEHDHDIITEEHVAEYRELFFLHLRRIDDIQHAILRHERLIVREGKPSTAHDDDHGHLRQEVQHFEASFLEFRKRFKAFAARHTGEGAA